MEKGLTLEQLSQQTKIPASTLGSYESDDYKEIPRRNIFDLAKFYGVSADYLLGMTENRQLDNISISELYLSDAALSLLKDRKIIYLGMKCLIPAVQEKYHIKRILPIFHLCAPETSGRYSIRKKSGCKRGKTSI